MTMDLTTAIAVAAAVNDGVYDAAANPRGMAGVGGMANNGSAVINAIALIGNNVSQLAAAVAEQASDVAGDAAAAEANADQASEARDQAVAAATSISAGVAGGLATLDSDGKVPLAQLTVHTHAKSDVTGLTATLDGKAAADLANVSNLDFANKAAAAGVSASTEAVVSTAAAATMAVQTVYLATHSSSRVVLTLPAGGTVAAGRWVEVVYAGAGGWEIAQQSGQSIIWSGGQTVAGAGDGLRSVSAGACVKLRYSGSGGVWQVVSVVGGISKILTPRLNAADKSSLIGLTAGDLTAARITGASAYSEGVRGTSALASGQWYFEVQITSGADVEIGVATAAAPLSQAWAATLNHWVYRSTGNKIAGNWPGAAFGSAFTTSLIMVAVNTSNNTIFFGKDGSWQGGGNPVTGANPAFNSVPAGVFPAIWLNTVGDSVTCNFAGGFVYAPPSGFSALS